MTKKATKKVAKKAAKKTTDKKISYADFACKAVKALRVAPHKGIHVVWSGFNDELRNYYGVSKEADKAFPRNVTDKLVADGIIDMRPVRGGAIMYLKGEGDYDPKAAKSTVPATSKKLQSILNG